MEAEILLAVSCLATGFGIRHFAPYLKRFRHQHIYYTMQSDGRFHCELCNMPKKKGS